MKYEFVTVEDKQSFSKCLIKRKFSNAKSVEHYMMVKIIRIALSYFSFIINSFICFLQKKHQYISFLQLYIYFLEKNKVRSDKDYKFISIMLRAFI